MAAFKVRDCHWEVICSFFEEHPSLATGRFIGPHGRESNKKLWNQLSLKLNALGLGERSPEKWQKTWTDFKYLLKRKATANMQDLNGTGGGPPMETPFNEFERRALSILGKSFYLGVGSTEIANKRSKPSTSSSRENLPPSLTEEPHTVSMSSLSAGTSTATNEHDYSYQPRPKKRKVVAVDDVYLETIEILKRIDNTVKKGLAEIAASIREFKSNT